MTPPPTPDSTGDAAEAKDEKPKVIQPKPVKSLANLPVGRKTGGILSLKDKSAGYPHLVNTDPEPAKKADKDEKKEQKPSQQSQNSNFQPKRQDHPPSPNWGPNMVPPTYEPRMNFHKNYGIQNAGISYNPSYQPGVNNNIRLPVVNPKEIDVRSAALQKQSSRQELFQDPNKFGHGYQVSGDKKNFLNDLPPRFANQYRYWQTAQENQFNDNKFRDDGFKNNSLFNNQQPSGWPANPPADAYPPPAPWWKPDNQPNFNSNYSTPAPPSMNLQSNFYSPHLTSNYQNVPSYGQGQLGPSKAEGPAPGYLAGPSLQSLPSAPGFGAALGGFGGYAGAGYDAGMYPQFGKLPYQPLKPPPSFKEADAPAHLGFGANMMDLHQRNLNFNEPLKNDMGQMKNLDQIGVCA